MLTITCGFLLHHYSVRPLWDLRELENGAWGDEWFKERVINGAERNGRVLMPRMADYISQEGLWAIRTWLETVSMETTGQ